MKNDDGITVRNIVLGVGLFIGIGIVLTIGTVAWLRHKRSKEDPMYDVFSSPPNYSPNSRGGGSPKSYVRDSLPALPPPQTYYAYVGPAPASPPSNTGYSSDSDHSHHSSFDQQRRPTDLNNRQAKLSQMAAVKIGPAVPMMSNQNYGQTYVQPQHYQPQQYLAPAPLQQEFAESSTMNSVAPTRMEKSLNLVVTNHDMTNLTLSTNTSSVKRSGSLEIGDHELSSTRLHQDPEEEEAEADTRVDMKEEGVNAVDVKSLPFQHPDIASLARSKPSPSRGPSVISDLSSAPSNQQTVLSYNRKRLGDSSSGPGPYRLNSDEIANYPDYYTLDKPLPALETS